MEQKVVFRCSMDALYLNDVIIGNFRISLDLVCTKFRN